jgi:hypothetical protein
LFQLAYFEVLKLSKSFWKIGCSSILQKQIWIYWLKHVLNVGTQFDIMTRIKGFFPTITNTLFNFFLPSIFVYFLKKFTLKIIYFCSKLYFVHKYVSESKIWKIVARKWWRKEKMFIVEITSRKVFFFVKLFFLIKGTLFTTSHKHCLLK